MKIVLALLLLASASLPAAPAAYTPITHQFVAIDEGLGRLLYVDETAAAKDWNVPLPYEHPRDLQLIGQGRVLVGHESGYAEFDLATGKLAKEVTQFHDVSSVRRLENGHTLLVGIDFDAPRPPGKAPSIKVVSQKDPPTHRVVLAEFDGDGQVLRRTVYPGDYSRLLRQTAAGTYLLACNDVVKELGPDGKVVWQASAPEFLHAWKALRLPNGNTLAAGGYGAVMVEFSPAGEIVRKFGTAAQLDPVFHPNFYAMFQVLANGHIVAANWQGHGPKHGNEGVQLLEFDPAGKVVWFWSDKANISSIQGVLVIDGLDRNRLYDDRSGPLAPIGN